MHPHFVALSDLDIHECGLGNAGPHSTLDVEHHLNVFKIRVGRDNEWMGLERAEWYSSISWQIGTITATDTLIANPIVIVVLACCVHHFD